MAASSCGLAALAACEAEQCPTRRGDGCEVAENIDQVVEGPRARALLSGGNERASFVPALCFSAS